jgi:hypothetical protein
MAVLKVLCAKEVYGLNHATFLRLLGPSSILGARLSLRPLAVGVPQQLCVASQGGGGCVPPPLPNIKGCLWGVCDVPTSKPRWQSTCNVTYLVVHLNLLAGACLSAIVHQVPALEAAPEDAA